MVTLRTTVVVILEFIRMNHLFTTRTLHPTAKSIFLSGFNFYLGLVPGKQS